MFTKMHHATSARAGNKHEKQKILNDLRLENSDGKQKHSPLLSFY